MKRSSEMFDLFVNTVIEDLGRKSHIKITPSMVFNKIDEFDLAESSLLLIKEINKTKHFKSNTTYNKYQKFLDIEERSKMSADELAEILSVSKSTIFEFRKINN